MLKNGFYEHTREDRGDLNLEYLGGELAKRQDSRSRTSPENSWGTGVATHEAHSGTKNASTSKIPDYW